MDLVDEVDGVSFVMEKDLHESMGDVKVEFVGNGYFVAPVDQAPSDCSSCSSCGE